MSRLLIIFLLFMSVICNGQQVSVKGILYDDATGKPVATATIACAHQVTHTDSNGYFRIFIQPHIQARLVASHPSYKSISRTFQAQSDTELVLFAHAHSVNLN